MIAVPDPVPSLYVHVPFCARKCTYCAFYSESSDGDLINRYVSALGRELEAVAAQLKPKTIFFGGGTPSLLNARQWEAVFGFFENVDTSDLQEWTIESNPATVSLDKAKMWREAGVNRVSMGVQSFDPDILIRLGRVHSRDMVFKSFDTLRKAGFENINIDLMFGIPGQSMSIWEDTLREALSLQSEHIACYEVIYEEDTALFRDLMLGRVQVNEDLICDMYERLIEETSRHGIVQYEIANFARKDRLFRDAREARPSTKQGDIGHDCVPYYACRHNVNYWRGGNYFGVGPSASGFVEGQRYKNISNTEEYCCRLERGSDVVEWRESLPAFRRAGEIAAFGLRMNSGWLFEEFAATTGFDLRVHWNEAMSELDNLGWARRRADRFHLTELGMRFADAAAERFLVESADPVIA